VTPTAKNRIIDMMQFRAGGAKVPHDEFLQTHNDLLRRDEWIIDGFGNVATAWERFAAADTLIYVDLPLFTYHLQGRHQDDSADDEPARDISH
jgi:hypothetical protein